MVDLEFNWSKPGKAQGTRSRRSKINYTAAHERTTVIDPHSDAASVALISHARMCAEC